MLRDYLKIKKEEFLDVLYIIVILSFMFGTLFARFSTFEVSYVGSIITYFLFFSILFYFRIIFMKFIAYNNGFEIHLKMTRFDRYGFRNYDRISYYAKKVDKKNIGIPMPLIGLLLYVLTLGIIVVPSFWRYKINKIPHKFIGSRQWFEKPTYMVPTEIGDYRYSKALFGGYLFYLIFALFLKIFISEVNSEYYYWFLFTIFWIAFITLIPVIGTEGYELFRRGRIAWICAIMILILGMLAIVMFNSMFYTIFFTIFGFVILFIYMFWKNMIMPD